jgi:hypothetical protein
MQCTSEHEIWNKQTRTRTPVRITRRRRQCSNRNCGVLFWTTQREEVDRG